MLSPRVWKPRVVFWGGALVVGATAAFFATLAEYANDRFRMLTDTSQWLPFLAAPAGLVAVLWIMRRFFAGSEGSGIPQAIAALVSAHDEQRVRLLSVRIAFGKILLTFLGLLSGASLGREGPTVHVGASVMYSIGRYARFPRHDMERGLILAGSAAGIAAAFNTPIAGIIFAIEEMSRSFEERTSGTLMLAVIIAGVTALAIKGNYTYFGSTDAVLGAGKWYIVPLCGVIGGFLGGAFSLALILGSARLAPLAREYPYRVAVACGLVIAITGLLSGQTTYGTGYHEAKGILTGSAEAGFFYPLLKMVATIASYLSGIPGGIFSPSLAAGAGLGADMAAWFATVPTAAVVVLGMVSYFAGVVQTPITAFVIVMELTDNQDMLFPLMAAAFIAYGTSRLICRVPIYRALSQRYIDAIAPAPPDPAPGKPG
jgi:H+/Cl- antiporter ClcA